MRLCGRKHADRGSLPYAAWFISDTKLSGYPCPCSRILNGEASIKTGEEWWSTALTRSSHWKL